MDFSPVRRLVDEKLRDRSTYVVALIVGTLINLFDQVLVLWWIFLTTSTIRFSAWRAMAKFSSAAMRELFETDDVVTAQ